MELEGAKMCDLLKAVNRYLRREFDEYAVLKRIPEDGIFHLAYTTYEFGDGKEHEIQVDFDLLNLKYLNYIDGKLVLEEPRECEQEFIDEMKACEFDDIIRDVVHKGFELYE